MKTLICAVFAMLFLFASENIVSGQSCNFSTGLIYTTCYNWQSGDGTIAYNGMTKNDDRPRLQRAIDGNPGKVIFNEAEYFISDALIIKSYRILEGTGRSAFIANLLANPPELPHLSSKIVQTSSNKSVFKIGINITDVSIRDLALVSGTGATGTMGIHAEGDCRDNCSSLSFQFSNLVFYGFDKGIYVNATDPPDPETGLGALSWQFDNIRLDHSSFVLCKTGVHLNSRNTGWNISSLTFYVPAFDPEQIGDETHGLFLERSTYVSMDTLIGNGPSSKGPEYATRLIYVREHGTLSIQNMVAEGFTEDIFVDGVSRDAPINLANNAFLNGVRFNNSTVYSSANQFRGITSEIPAIAQGTSQIYSMGDKFCVEGSVGCDEGLGTQRKATMRE